MYTTRSTTTLYFYEHGKKNKSTKNVHFVCAPIVCYSISAEEKKKDMKNSLFKNLLHFVE